MDTISVIDEQDIKQQVGDRSLSLGRQYAGSGAIFDARLQGTSLKARCAGTSGGPYRVQVDCSATGIVAASCTCPVGTGGHCKHVAALLLTWLSDPEQFTKTEETDRALERRDKAELVALVKQMLLRYPDLEVLLETPLPVTGVAAQPVNAEIYRRQAAAIFHGAQHSWGEEIGLADQLLAIKAIGDGFLEQAQYANAVAVFEAVLAEVLDNYEMFGDDGGELYEVITACVESLGTCLEHETSIETREIILRALFSVYRFDIKIGGIGLSDQVPELILQHVGADERHLVVQWVQDALPNGEGWSNDFQRQAFGAFLLDLRSDDLSDDEFLRICRKTGRTNDLVNRLLTLGRVDEAIAEAAQAADHPLLDLADLLVRHGQDKAAERLVEDRSAASDDWRLLSWLQARHMARQDLPGALDLAVRIFHRYPDLDRYRDIRSLASQLNRWDRLRPDLLSFLETARLTSLLINIYLDEKEIDAALSALQAGPHWGGIELAVAQAAEATRPPAAREIYRQRAEHLIEQRGRGNYAQACTLLVKICHLSEQMGDDEGWQTYIADLRERTHQLRALKEEMAVLGL